MAAASQTAVWVAPSPGSARSTLATSCMAQGTSPSGSV
jgi:hypothetical protein